MESSHKILAIIPARAGSKRVIGKNKKLLNGKPLVNYAIEAALSSKQVDTIVVSSDDNDILKLAKEFKGIIPIKRPPEISGDKANAITYVHHVLSTLERAFDYIVIIQPSSPFTLGEDIDKTILILTNSKADSSVSVMKLDHAIHPAKLKLMEEERLIPYIEKENGRMAAHELPEIYVRNCSVYVSTIQTIRDGKVIGDQCLGYEMPRERSIDINDPIDFEFAEFLMKKYG